MSQITTSRKAIRGSRGARKKRFYTPKEYSNPYFQKKRKNISPRLPKLSWKAKLIVLAVVLLFIFLSWALLFSSLLKINDINITIYNSKADELPESVRIDNDDIKEVVRQQTHSKLYGFIPQNNLILFSKDLFRKKIGDKYVFEDLVIKKTPLHEISIEVSEMNYALIWRENDKFYYTDLNGNIITEINPLELQQKQYPFVDNRGTSVISDNRIGNTDAIIFTVELYDKYRDEFPSHNIESFIVDDELNTVKLQLVDGPQIYFNTTDEVDKQLTKLKVIVEEKLKDEFFTKTYINVKFGDRVYIR